tara:strand:- start:31 stop:648 length:618 start_codon:yes stop_codon:yes gene_type:complete
MSIVTLNDRAVRSVTTFGSVSGGSMVFIKKLTASSSSTLSFVDGASSVVLDNTYKEYLFTFKDIHPGTNEVTFRVNFSADGGSNYNVAKTGTNFYAGHTEADATGFGSAGGQQLAQATGKAYVIVGDMGSGNDETCAGYFYLFNPSSTTFVKHWMGTATMYGSNPQSQVTHSAGYANTTSAIDAVQFSMSSGNIDAGDICLYGIL